MMCGHIVCVVCACMLCMCCISVCVCTTSSLIISSHRCEPHPSSGDSSQSYSSIVLVMTYSSHTGKSAGLPVSVWRL